MQYFQIKARKHIIGVHRAMAKKFELVCDIPLLNIQEIDWGKCIFCQTLSTDPLTCPVRSKQEGNEKGYKTLATHLLGFSELGLLPKHLNLSDSKGDCITKETLKTNSAKWHCSCQLQFNKTELLRAKKKADKKTEEKKLPLF